jgi:hypothetical protein
MRMKVVEMNTAKDVTVIDSTLLLGGSVKFGVIAAGGASAGLFKKPSCSGRV